MADYPNRTYVQGAITDHPRSVVITRHNTATAEQVLSLRPGYIIALFIHMKGMQNAQPYEGCRRAYRGEIPFPHYVGCISFFSFQGGACSNCVHPRGASSCSLHNVDPNNINIAYEDLRNRGMYTTHPRGQVPRDQGMPGGVIGSQLRTRLGSRRALPAPPPTPRSPNNPDRGSQSP